MRATTIVVVSATLQSVAETVVLETYEFEWHTPGSYKWDVLNMNAVSGHHLKDSGVWSPGKTESFEECQEMCANNITCNGCDWAGDVDIHRGNCLLKKICYFRSDGFWQPVANGNCNHTAARKVSRAPTPPPKPKPNPPLGYQPNIVFILTDDQDTRLGRNDYTDIGSLEIMPRLNHHLMQGGARMRNAFVNTPICCPSRTEFFSGRYFHNIGPPNDPGGCMHVDTSTVARKNSGLFGQMVGAGYEVGVFGKVTNDQLRVLKMMSKEGSMTWASSPINYNSFMGLPYYRDFGNGTTLTETLDMKQPTYGTVYQSTQIGNRTLDWLDALHGDPKRSKKPFFAYIGPHAPHYPAQPAPWYENAFDDVTIPITPNYNLSCPDKTQHVRQNPPLTDLAKCWEDQHFRDRWASLLSVDDILDAVVARLEEYNLLQSTFIFYSSDHGYKQGQWRIGTSKEHPYETDIRVPLLVRGPGIKAGTTYDQLTMNVDVAPTILDLAGIRIPNFVDGRSMLPWLIAKEALTPERQLTTDQTWRNQMMHEYLSVGTYFNDHSAAWQKDKTTTARCGGPMPRGPAGNVKDCNESDGVGNGNCYFVDSKHSNSWRALRILTDKENLIYIEYDPTWKWKATDATGAGLQHYELYDITKDPYQMTNIYVQAGVAKRTELHAAISKYYVCRGDLQTPTTCHDADRKSAFVSSQLVV